MSATQRGLIFPHVITLPGSGSRLVAQPARSGSCRTTWPRNKKNFAFRSPLLFRASEAKVSARIPIVFAQRLDEPSANSNQRARRSLRSLARWLRHKQGNSIHVSAANAGGVAVAESSEPTTRGRSRVRRHVGRALSSQTARRAAVPRSAARPCSCPAVALWRKRASSALFLPGSNMWLGGRGRGRFGTGHVSGGSGPLRPGGNGRKRYATLLRQGLRRASPEQSSRHQGEAGCERVRE